MASESKKTKSETAPKKDATAKVESPAAEAAKDAPKSGGAEAAATAPANYSRGEGQKPVTAAYRENWNAIFAKKSAKRKAR